MSSLTAPVLAKVKLCDTSFAIWTKLDTLFASKTDAHLIHLKESLSSFKKGSSTMSDYIQSIKSIVDSLVASGVEIFDR
ncbi:hypothetical protein C5167_049783 [Papaver somniferum]|uniref:Uncharacterized protein n=1 Tax=Papaver somniferum TaxID=3469 RepID=A0A4Y7KN67_PAPSO|nr:hypothetical protein C5167_049783 [Papaver somniferum]